MKRLVPVRLLSNARSADVIAVVLLLFLPQAFFWRETLGRATLGDKDAVFWFFPAYRFVAEQLKQGRLPLLTPYLYCGEPLLAEWVAGVFDPLNWIYLVGTTSRTLTLSLQITFSIALVAMFCYARSIGFKRRSSILAAVVYGLSGFAVGRTLYPGLLHIFALTPLVFFFVERLYKYGRWRDSIGGGCIVAWQVFAGHPQPLIYSSLSACAYALFCAFGRGGDSQPPEVKPRIGFLVRFGVMFIAGIGMSAVQLLPAAEFARESVRREWPYELFTLHSLHPVSLLTTLFPFFHGEGKTIFRLPYWGPYWHNGEAQIYLGVVALSLCFAGVVAAWRNRTDAGRFRIGRFWSLIAIAGVILSMGKYTGPISRILYHVPVLGQFRSPNRHWMEVTLAVAVLAGYAVDRILQEESKLIARGAQIASFSLFLLCALAGGIVLWRTELTENWIRSLPDLNQLPQGFLRQAGAEFYLPIIVSLIGALAIILFARAKLKGGWYGPLLIVVILDFNLYATFAPINSSTKLESLLGGAMPAALAAKQSERDPIRYHVMLNPATGEFNPFWFYGHEMATGYDPLLNQQVKTFLGIDEAGRTFDPTMLEQQNHTLDLLNVRYIFVPPAIFDSIGLKPGDASEGLELRKGGSAIFETSEGSGDWLTIVSSLSNSIEIANGETVAEIAIKCESGAKWATALRAGQDTSEWAYDRADVRDLIKHSRAKIAESRSGDARSSFEAHTYIARVGLPEELKTCRTARTVEITAKLHDSAALTINRVALEDSISRKTNALIRSPQAALGDTARWREIAQSTDTSPFRDYRIYENLRAMPRAWLVNRVRIEWEGDQHKMIRGQIEGFDPRQVALVEPIDSLQNRWYRDFEARPGSPIEETGAAGRVRILEHVPDKLIVETESDKPALLVLSEFALPGWKVKVDGRPASWYRVNYLLRATPLDTAGKHAVEFVYEPLSLKIGAVVTLTTALSLILLFVWERRKFKAVAASV